MKTAKKELKTREYEILGKDLQKGYLYNAHASKTDTTFTSCYLSRPVNIFPAW